MAAIVAAGLLAPAIGFGQGLIDGFMRGAGRTNVALSYSWESYSEFWKGTTLVSEPNLGKITTQSVNAYAAHGLTKDLDLIVNIPYVFISPSAGTWSSQNGFQDIAVALKYRPLQAEVEGLGRIDLIGAASLSTPATDYINDAPVAIGHYSTNGDLRAVAQLTTDFGGFVQAQGGYIRRGKVMLDKGYEVAVPDAIDLSAKIGYFTEDFYVDAWVQRQNAQEGTDIKAQTTFPSNAVSFTRVGLTGYYPLPMVHDLGITVGGALTLDGRNTGKSARVSGGVVYGFNLY